MRGVARATSFGSLSPDSSHIAVPAPPSRRKNGWSIGDGDSQCAEMGLSHARRRDGEAAKAALVGYAMPVDITASRVLEASASLESESTLDFVLAVAEGDAVDAYRGHVPARRGYPLRMPSHMHAIPRVSRQASELSRIFPFLWNHITVRGRGPVVTQGGDESLMVAVACVDLRGSGKPIAMNCQRENGGMV